MDRMGAEQSFSFGGLALDFPKLTKEGIGVIRNQAADTLPSKRRGATVSP